MRLANKLNKKSKRRFVKPNKQEKIGDNKDIKTVNKSLNQERQEQTQPQCSQLSKRMMSKKSQISMKGIKMMDR